MKKVNKIYKITNIVTNKMYIGQTINELSYRLRHHLKPSSKCPALKDAVVKYGRENFKIELICECKDLVESNELESYYIQKFNTLSPNGYNLEEGGKFCPYNRDSVVKAGLTKRGMRYKNRRRGVRGFNLNTNQVVEVEAVKDFLEYDFTKSDLSNIRTLLSSKKTRKTVKGWTFEYINTTPIRT